LEKQNKTTKKTALKKTAVKKTANSKKTASKKTAAKKPVKKIKPEHTADKTSINSLVPKEKPKKKKNAIEKFEDMLNPPADAEVKDIEEIDPEALNRGDHPMTVVEHLDEFRSRFLKVFALFVICTGVAFYFSDYIIYFINKPFLDTGNKLNIFKLTGGFMIRLKSSAGVAILVAVPYLLFQAWRFIAPAIGTTERAFSRISIITSVLLFYSGVAFVFFLMIPFTIEILLGFISTDMLSTIGADDYLSFIFLFCLLMGVLFETPIIILILTKLGIITPHLLITKRKYAIVIIWIIAALVSPPDIISQILCGIPLMFLYEISIVISRITMKRKKLKELQADRSI